MLPPIPAEMLEIRLSGRNLNGDTLREELAAGLRLLVFLRHFG